MWISAAIQRPNELPVVNVVAFVLIVAERDPGLAREADLLGERPQPRLITSGGRAAVAGLDA